MDTTSDPAFSAILDWLEDERRAFLQAAMLCGVGPTHVVTIPVAIHRPGGGLTFERRPSVVSSYDAFAFPLIRVRSQLVLVSRPRPEGLLIAHFGEQRIRAATVPEDSRQPDWRHRLVESLMMMLDEHLSSIDSLEHEASAASRAAVKAYVEHLESGAPRKLYTLPIGGIAPPAEPLEHDGVVLRALTPEELGAVHETPDDLVRRWSRRSRSISRQSTFSTETSVLSETHLASEDAQQRLRLDRVVLALELVGVRLCGSGWVTSQDEPYANFRMSYPLPLRMQASETPAPSAATFRAAVELAEKIPPEAIHSPDKSAAVALHRFRLATAHQDPSEAVIDYVIALEALLTPGSTSESTYRLSIHGARFLESTLADRKATRKELAKLYGLRSRLVHGSATRESDIEKWRSRAHDLARRCLLKALRGRWPDQDSFVDLVLE